MRPQHWLYTIPLRLRSLFRQRQADQELDDELRDHVERRTEEYVASGLPSEEARRQALLEMGGIEKRKEECRGTRRVTWIQDFAQDLHYAVRMLRKSPGFTAVVILTLALGIGVNTAIFNLVDSILLKPLSFPNSSRVVRFYQANPESGYSASQNSLADLEDARKQNDVFDLGNCGLAQHPSGRYAKNLRDRTGSASPLLHAGVVPGHWHFVRAGSSDLRLQTLH
jgi:macrolide transport system ATP-binding/permease protein